MCQPQKVLISQRQLKQVQSQSLIQIYHPVGSCKHQVQVWQASVATRRLKNSSNSCKRQKYRITDRSLNKNRKLLKLNLLCMFKTKILRQKSKASLLDPMLQKTLKGQEESHSMLILLKRVKYRSSSNRSSSIKKSSV